MCGISGIVHSKNVAKNLFNSIRNLEYRGYDSCGMALMFHGFLDLRKNIGGIDEVNLISIDMLLFLRAFTKFLAKDMLPL